tara:strand:+ start:1335 stop:1586 length:252 start_codon:yes stop_codon:yes gene_type:complete
LVGRIEEIGNATVHHRVAEPLKRLVRGGAVGVKNRAEGIVVEGARETCRVLREGAVVPLGVELVVPADFVVLRDPKRARVRAG